MPAPAPTAGAMPYVWFLSSALLVLALDQATEYGTVPFKGTHPLMDLGLAGAVAVLWVRGMKIWPAVALAGLASGFWGVQHQFGVRWLSVPLYAAGLVGGGVTARFVLAKCGFDSRLRNVTDVLALAILAAPLAALAAAVPPILVTHDWPKALRACFAECFSGWIGILMLTPFLLSLGAEYFQRWNPARIWEWLLINLLLVACLLLMMTHLGDGDQRWFPLAYLALPCVFWSAWRFGPPGAALANIFVGEITALCAWQGIGPFEGSPRLLTLLLAWSFLGFHGLIALLLAALTDERRVELGQQRQRARFLRQVLEELPCGILLKDVADKPVFVNRRWFQLFGRVAGNEEDQLRHQQSTDAFWRGRELALLQNLGELLREEANSRDPKGRPLELLLSKQAAYFEERGERLLMVVANDLTGGRTSLGELRATVARMQETLAVAEVSMWEWNIPMGLIRFDAQFSRLTGLPERPEGLSVVDWQTGIHEEDRAQFQSDMLRHLHHQAELFATRFRYKRTDGWVWLVVRGRVVEKDVRDLGIRMIGTLQEARATVLPLPDPNAAVTV